MTAAVEQAVRNRLDRVRRVQHTGMAECLLKIGKECAPLWKEPLRLIEHGDLRTTKRSLFDGDRFREISRLIHIASPPHRDVIGQQLQRNDLQNRREFLGRGWDV
jgi:hypothetical protein